MQQSRQSLKYLAEWSSCSAAVPFADYCLFCFCRPWFSYAISTSVVTSGFPISTFTAEMEDLDQPALLEELQARFNRDVIYTYVGEILVSINPFKMIDVSAPCFELWRFMPLSRLRPHLHST
jgi:hypothetical protein